MNRNGLSRIAFGVAFTILIVLFSGCKDNSVVPKPNETPIPMDEAPSWSPDGQWIAYTHISVDLDDTTYPTGLYIIDTSGQNRRLVIAGPVYSPDWSPDGRRIAFSSGDVFTINPSGDSLDQLTSFGSSFVPSWSPDGSMIAFGRSGPSGTVGIWIIDLGNHVARRWGIGGAPDWSPDGTKFIYGAATGPYTMGITVVSVNNPSEKSILVDNDHPNVDPAWSPDGLSIAWTTDTGVWLMNVDGNNQHLLVGDYAGDPSWSPDSKEIVFKKIAPIKRRVFLWKINVDGTNAKQLTH